MKIIVVGIIVLMSFFSNFSIAQDYETSIGLRGGFSNGLTIKHFLGGKSHD